MLIEAISTRNVTLAQRFYDEHLEEEFRSNFSLDSYTDGYQYIARSTGGLDFYGVRTYDPPRAGTTTVVCKDRLYGSWWAIVLYHGDDVEAGVTDMRISRARTPADVAETPLTVSGLVEEIGSMLDRVCEAGVFSGTVLVARGNDVLVEHACGEASKRFAAPIGIDTKSNIGSLNKMFTAVAVAQLAEQGRLSYEDRLSEFIDESWLPAEVLDKVTIHHLLTHSSGLGDFFNDTFETGARKRFRTVGDYRELVRGDSLRFDPGTDWSYSNTGFLLLGAVIESVTGEDYFDYVREHVYDPAGMSDTDCYDMECPVENLAIGYWPSTHCEGGWKNNYFEHVIRGGPARGGFSTVRDLSRFTGALASGALVSGETIQRMWTDYREGDRGYGYGFMRRETPKGTVVGHDGGFLGIEAYYDVYIETGHTVVVLTNVDEAAWPVDVKIRELMARLE